MKHIEEYKHSRFGKIESVRVRYDCIDCSNKCDPSKSHLISGVSIIGKQHQLTIGKQICNRLSYNSIKK